MACSVLRLNSNLKVYPPNYKHFTALFKKCPIFTCNQNRKLNPRQVCKNHPQSKYNTNCAPEEAKGRHNYHEETEKLINEQILMEFKACFAYLSIACYFGRTEIALPGCQGYFMNMHMEEHDHATILINYQLMRGGHVKLCPIPLPDHNDWKGIHCAFETALSIEKLVKEKLEELFFIAEKHKDLQVMDLVSNHFLEEQNRSICELARLLTRAKMAEDRVGVYLFDKSLYKSFVKKAGDNLMYRGVDKDSDKDVYK